LRAVLCVCVCVCVCVCAGMRACLRACKGSRWNCFTFEMKMLPTHDASWHFIDTNKVELDWLFILFWYRQRHIWNPQNRACWVWLPHWLLSQILTRVLVTCTSVR
jgi:hypothetical protein